MLYLMIACVFLSCGVVAWSGGQIRMDAIVALLPRRARIGLEVLADIVMVITCIVLALMAWPVVAMLAQFDQRSQAANLPLAIPQAMMPIGFVIMALLIVLRMATRKSGTRHGSH
jgi:TRAP-type C4-dicarboxylate transport system permease small subunit